MSSEILATRCFTAADQEAFAVLSGDRNPMHMDPIAARRTLAGQPVVHGIHMLLWSLDSLARHHKDLPAVASVRVRFDKLVYVGDSVNAILTQRNAAGVRLEVLVEDAVALRLQMVFGSEHSEPRIPETAPITYTPLDSKGPLDLGFDEMPERSGRIGFAVSFDEFTHGFPDAARAWGPGRLTALAGSSYLVGMVCPGLQSIFGGMDIRFYEEATEGGAADGVAFKVRLIDPRFRLVRMEIAGSGLFGTLETFARHPPVKQKASSVLAKAVRVGEFADSTALVIGGSRGLGEITAKLLAAGGANVIITYATGRVDAEQVQAEITSSGGSCRILPYDIRNPAEPQLDAFIKPDTLYYFATPPISRRKTGLFVAGHFADFLTFYVTSFYELCRVLRYRRPAGFSVFYPSSVFVEARPANMTEYAMSKMAGELLCADIVAFQQPIAIVINRLPRLPTDQTATLIEAEASEPVAVMLPIIREVQAKRFG